MKWTPVLEELKNFQKSLIPLNELSELTMDTLHGSMWGLNHRYMTLEEALEKDRRNILIYSILRIEVLTQAPNISFRRRKSEDFERCGIGFGTYGWKYDEKIITTAVNLGACLIDTAEGYGYGKVETALGKILKSCKPVDVLTKVRRDHMGPIAICNAVFRSKDKLGIVPHIQTHFPHVGRSQVMRHLAMLRQEGHVLSIGLGNCSVDMIESAQRFLSDYSGDVIRSVQVRFNLADRRIKEVLLPYCQARGILVLAYSPLGQNFRDFHRPILSYMAERYNATPAQVALAWIQEHPRVVPIPRTNNLKHLEENMEADELELDCGDIQELEEEYQQESI